MDNIKLFFNNIGQWLLSLMDKKSFKRFAPLVLIVLVTTTTLVTCITSAQPMPLEKPEPPVLHVPGAKPTPEPTAPPVTEPEDPGPDISPDPDPPYAGPFNPLTGEPTVEDISNNRPLAIVINNINVALPQLGISGADIIYEVLVESGITRMLALYQDVSNVGVIGSIRSARFYFVDIAQSYDSVFIFTGGSPQAYEAVTARRLTYLDDITGPHRHIFYRDQHRRVTMGSEHSLVTSGALITEHLPTYNNFRLTHNEGYKRNLLFTEDGAPENGEPAANISVSFSTYKPTLFSYDEEDNLYYLRQYNRSYVDGNNNSHIGVTNVLVLRTNVSGIPGDREGRLNIRTTGTGEGYYINGGKYIEIEWSREGEADQYEYALPDGTPLVLGQGKTYICIIPTNQPVTFE